MKELNSRSLRLIISAFVAIAAGVVIYILTDPYILEVGEKRPFLYDKSTTYYDLDSDGKSEMIVLSNSSTGITGVVVYDHSSRILDQFNVQGSIVRKSEIFRGDYNNDGFSELYIFTTHDDSLFLNVLDVYNANNPYLKRRYIPGCKSLNGEAQYMISGTSWEDANDDRRFEIYFSIAAGFTLQPRAFYYYDLVNDRLERSDISGTPIRGPIRSFDLDSDGKQEIWGSSYAVGNYNTAIPYSDSSAWLMIFDHRLDYFFKPVEYKGYTSAVITSVLNGKSENSLVVLRTLNAFNDSINNTLDLYSVSGELLTSVSLKEYKLGQDLVCLVCGNEIYIVDKDGYTLIFDRDLSLKRKVRKEWLSGIKIGPFIVPVVEEDIFINLTVSGELTVYTCGLKKLASLYINDNTRSGIIPVFVSNSKVKSGFHLRTADYDYVFRFEKNRAGNFLFIYVVIIFFGFYFLIFFIQNQQHKQEEKKREVESRMRTLQTRAAKSQISPHFIFNALNSISAMYIKGDVARADEFLTSFSRMIREVVDSSDKLVVTVDEEVEFVRNYLELEKVRHEDRLSFEIKLPRECKSVNLPSMSVHTFVENSIKHGFRGKDKMHIQINVLCHSKTLNIIIEDNGAGFNSEKGNIDREGKGLQMIRDIFETYYSISDKRIEYNIVNLSDEYPDGRQGTRVEIIADK